MTSIKINIAMATTANTKNHGFLNYSTRKGYLRWVDTLHPSTFTVYFQKELQMKSIVTIALAGSLLLVSGCTSEKIPEPAKSIPAIVLSIADKEKLQAFQKEILSVETITDKALNLAGVELKNVIKGGAISVNLPSVIDKAKSECLLAGETLAKKAVPEALPPEAKTLLNDGKTGLVAAYKAYADSFDAIKSFVTDKNPMALLEYRKKNAEAQALLKGATEKLKMIMTAAGVTQ
jgi:hypothetical protein